MFVLSSGVVSARRGEPDWKYLPSPLRGGGNAWQAACQPALTGVAVPERGSASLDSYRYLLNPTLLLSPARSGVGRAGAAAGCGCGGKRLTDGVAELPALVVWRGGA